MREVLNFMKSCNKPSDLIFVVLIFMIATRTNKHGAPRVCVQVCGAYSTRIGHIHVLSD